MHLYIFPISWKKFHENKKIFWYIISFKFQNFLLKIANILKLQALINNEKIAHLNYFFDIKDEFTGFKLIDGKVAIQFI